MTGKYDNLELMVLFGGCELLTLHPNDYNNLDALLEHLRIIFTAWDFK